MSFSADLTGFCDKYKIGMKTVVRKIAFEAFKRIILRTPVDTGRARANWGVMAAKPRMTVLIMANDKSGADTLNKAKDEVFSWSGDGSIFMTNNLPYIGVLEYGGFPNPPKVGSRVKGKKFGSIKSVGGYSYQAPKGMVRVTMVEMENFVKAMIE
jgi:hypothetical protein